MPSESPFPVPPDDGTNMMMWFANNRSGIIEALRFVNRLKALQSANGNSTASPYNLLDSDDNAILLVPRELGAVMTGPVALNTAKYVPAVLSDGTPVKILIST